MIKNFNVEAAYKKIILDSRRPVLNPTTGRFLVLKENVSRVQKETKGKVRVLFRRGGFENDKC